MDLNKIVSDELESLNRDNMDEFKRKVRGYLVAIANLQGEIRKKQAEIDKLKAEMKELKLEPITVTV